MTNIPMAEGMEVFPTIEVIDRIYAPQGQERRFAIPVDIAEDDLKLAADGKFVMRVIYLEDPRNALPAREDPKVQNWFEVRPGQDPLAVADGLGRPVAILRMGARMPAQGDVQDEGFFIGSPPFVAYPPEKAAAPKTVQSQVAPPKGNPSRNAAPKVMRPQEVIPRGTPFQDEAPKTNTLREETPKADKPQDELPQTNALREEAAPKGNVLREETPKAHSPEEKTTQTNAPQKAISKVDYPRAEVPKVNILPPPPETSKGEASACNLG